MISVYGQTNNCQKAISVDPEKTALVGEVKFGPYIDCTMISVYGQTNYCQKSNQCRPRKDGSCRRSVTMVCDVLLTSEPNIF